MNAAPVNAVGGPGASGGIAPADPHTMQCLEVWGGYGVSDNGVVMPGLDVWVFSRPYMEAHEGGDVHYVSSCGTGRISRLLVADVSGHGTTVAAIAKDLRDLMRRHVNFVEQRVFVEKLNGSFVELTKNGLFATAAVATFFAPSQTLTLTNAGHPRPLLYSHERKSWRLCTEDSSERGKELSNLPLGMFAETNYPSVMLQAATGDVVVIYSDSLIEAPLPEPGNADGTGAATKAGKKGRLLGTAGLLEVASSLPIEPTATFATRLYAAVLAKCAPGTQTLGDDVTILVLRPNGLKEPAPLSKRLGAAVAFFKTAAKSAVGGPGAPWPELGWTNIVGALVRKVSNNYGRGAERI